MTIKFRIREVRTTNTQNNCRITNSSFYAEKLNVMYGINDWVDITHNTGNGMRIFLSYANAYDAIVEYRQKLLSEKNPEPEELIYNLSKLNVEIDLLKEEPEILYIDNYNYAISPALKRHFMNFTNWIRYGCDVHDDGTVFLKNSTKCFDCSDDLYKFWNITINKKDCETKYNG